MCENNVVEDKTHFILVCPAYDDIRTQLYNSVRCNNFIELNAEQKFLNLFKNESEISSKYIEKLWEVRCLKLYNM